MRFVFRGAALLVAGVLLCSVLPAQEKEAGKTDKTEPTEKPASAKPAAKTTKKKKLDWGQVVKGKLTKLDTSNRNFTLQVLVPDPQKVQANKIHYAQRLAQISQVRNPLDKQRQLGELQLDMARREADSGKKENYDLRADDDLVVRVAKLPTEYDDKGKPKRLTSAQIKARKGPDPNLPGYTAEFDDLQRDQYVTVYLEKQKQGQAKAARKKTDDEGDGVTERPKAVMIMITADASKNR